MSTESVGHYRCVYFVRSNSNRRAYKNNNSHFFFYETAWKKKIEKNTGDETGEWRAVRERVLRETADRERAANATAA